MNSKFKNFDYYRKLLLAIKTDDDLYFQKYANNNESNMNNYSKSRFNNSKTKNNSSNKFYSFSYLEYLLNRKISEMSGN